MQVSESILRCHYQGHDVRVATAFRDAGTDLLILLHGIGCSKKSFSGAFDADPLQQYSICALDFPGYGQSSKNLPPDFFTLRAYAAIARQVVSHLTKSSRSAYARVCVAGHSMGGAVAVLMAEGNRGIERVVSADGNLVAEDCGLVSRGIAGQNPQDFASKGFGLLLTDLRRSTRRGSRAWAEWLAQTSPDAMHESARSLVEWSDSGKLLEQFNSLEKRAFLYGAQDDKRYLVDRIAGAVISAVPDAGHFMMVDNPDSFYETLSRALRP